MIKVRLSEIEPVHFIVPFDPVRDTLCRMDLTNTNNELTNDILTDTVLFSQYIAGQVSSTNCRYGIGGYAELRSIYSRSSHFDEDHEPRRLHLGTDLWGEVGTLVHAPLPGVVHSVQYNGQFGDYGATIILQHHNKGFTFHTLYGHLDMVSIQDLQAGEPITAGRVIARFGDIHENGHWPPHLHFQIIIDMGGQKGDYPGVCKYSEREQYLSNS